MLTTNTVHQTAIISPKAKIGTGNYIGPYCIIGDNVILGNFNRLESHVCVGSPAEHREAFHGEKDCGTLIGDHNIFREFVTINSGIDKQTMVGNNVYMLRGSHLGHDVEVKSKVTISCNVMVGGHATIRDGANIGLGTLIHQHIEIGAFTMIGMGSIVTKNVENFILGYGNPFKPRRINTLGLQRNGFTEDQISELESAFTHGL